MMPMSQWTLSKTTKGIENYNKKLATPDFNNFRLVTEFDFPPMLIVEYCRDVEKRIAWDDQYDFIKFVKSYKLNTFLLNIQAKAQWPVTARSIMLTF